MFRSVLTFILIAHLLVCPLCCASCGAGEESAGESALATCSCCHYGDDFSQESDDVPMGDCSCVTCLCEGATLQEGIHLSDVGSQSACLGYGLAVIQRITACENDDGSCAFYGCNMRLVVQSWLI